MKRLREYKFRGKRVDNGKWAYGAFVPDALEQTHGKMVTWGFIRRYKPNRTVESVEMIEVDRNTVGQYTGLKDKNGKKIYEGDIVKVTDDNDEISELNSDTGIGAIEWLDKWGFWNISRIENSLGDINNSYDIEVIGNIFDNPELLEVEQ